MLEERGNRNSGCKRKPGGRWVVPLGEADAIHMGSTRSGEQNDEVIERGGESGFRSGVRHSGQYDGKGIGNSADCNEHIEESENKAINVLVYALVDLASMQKQDPELYEIITYLNTGDLQKSDRASRKILLMQDQFTIDDGVL